MIKELSKVGGKMSVRQASISTSGLFINYRVPTELVPAEFNSVSAKPDSLASISANKTVIFSDEVIEEIPC